MTWELLDRPRMNHAPHRELTEKEKDARRQIAEAAEAHRKKKRAELKQRADAVDLYESQRVALVAAIDAANHRKDTLAARHCEQAAPIQSRLQEIERQQVAYIKARRPADAEIESERVGLLAQVRELNSALEAAVKAEDDKIAALEVERRTVAGKCGKSIIHAELINLAHPHLMRVLKVAQSAERWAQRRRDAAENISDNELRKLELADAAAALATAEQRVAKALQAVIDE